MGGVSTPWGKPNSVNLLAALSPTFAAWTQNPDTPANMTAYLPVALTTNGLLQDSIKGYIHFDLGSTKRVLISTIINLFNLGASTNGVSVYAGNAANPVTVISTESKAASVGLRFQPPSIITEARYISFSVISDYAAGARTVNSITLIAFEI